MAKKTKKQKSSPRKSHKADNSVFIGLSFAVALMCLVVFMQYVPVV